MFQGAKSKFDLYLDAAANITTQVINNPKTGPIAGAFSLSVWYADIAGAAGAVSGILGAVGAGVMIWVTVERWLFDRKIKRQELRQRKLKNNQIDLETRQIELEIKSLEQAMKKRGGN